MKYRKKPVVIEAWQWVGPEDEMPIPPAPSELLDKRVGVFSGIVTWHIKTLEGWYKLTPNDWIIRGIQGEYYPCKPDIFAATYEPA